MDASTKTIWKGMSQPVVKRGQGYLSPFTGVDTVRTNIRNILLTNPGERLCDMVSYGSRLNELVFEQNDELFSALAHQYCVDALRQWGDKFDILGVNISPDVVNLDVYITIAYRIKQSVAAEDSLVLKFDRDRGIVT